MTGPIVNLADIQLRPRGESYEPRGEAAERFEASTAMVGSLIGAQKLGYNLTSVRPGKRAFPFHSHQVNEEMFLVLDGEGELRFGDAVYRIRKGDIIACPPGGRDTAHQIINSGAGELKYLAVSTKLSPEICEYPDSDKFGILAVLSTDADQPPRRFAYVGREQSGLDYWEGE
jgi:uncharacterized cupin superfamily protein